MRLQKPGLVVTGLAVAAVLTLAVPGCQDSNSVVGPAAVNSPAKGMDLSGTWTGAFLSDGGPCRDPAASATLQQSGTTITGTLTISACGISGRFRGEIAGSAVNGSIAMSGCTGGAVAGTATASSMSLTVGDLLKPLVTGDRVVMAGGTLSLRR